jgi:MerR family transcriptional regulator, copper efflux regulator
MLIGEVAREAGVSRDTVRLYTRLGLVSCASRQAGSRVYADYDPGAVELIKGIKAVQSLGFTLSELGPIAAAYVAGSLDEARERALLAAKLDEIEDKRRQLDQMSGFLRAKLESLCVNGDDGSPVVACSLGQDEGAQRAARWKALTARALVKRSPTDRGLQLAFDAGPGVAEELSSLVDLERECCAFAAWSVHPSGGQLILEAAGDSHEAATAIQAMFLMHSGHGASPPA